MVEFRQRMLRMSGDRAYRLARAITGDDRRASDAVHRAVAECGEQVDELDFLMLVRDRALAGKGGRTRRAAAHDTTSDHPSLEPEISTEDRSLLVAVLTGTTNADPAALEEPLAAALERLRASHTREFRLHEEDIP